MFKKTYSEYGMHTEDKDSPFNGLGKGELIEEALERLPDWNKLRHRTLVLFKERYEKFANGVDEMFHSNAWLIIDAYIDAAEVDKNEQTP